jgi:hypothetical protein
MADWETIAKSIDEKLDALRKERHRPAILEDVGESAVECAAGLQIAFTTAPRSLYFDKPSVAINSRPNDELRGEKILVCTPPRD